MKRRRIGILTVSDKGSRGEREDKSGPLLQELVRKIDGKVIAFEVIPDNQKIIEEHLIQFADMVHCNLILTTGGTGLAPKDITPEATKAIIEKEVPGLAEFMRFSTFPKTKMASLSRGIAGIRGDTLIINLPGSPKGVKECFAALVDVLPHALDLLQGETEHHFQE